MLGCWHVDRLVRANSSLTKHFLECTLATDCSHKLEQCSGITVVALIIEMAILF